jgi:hypothetical protein
MIDYGLRALLAIDRLPYLRRGICAVGQSSYDRNHFNPRRLDANVDSNQFSRRFFLWQKGTRLRLGR